MTRGEASTLRDLRHLMWKLQVARRSPELIHWNDCFGEIERAASRSVAPPVPSA
jgi:hypothetical protein